ncbi:unnamed protein product [Wuchereria bancrofti]|uniref:Uncharacterized protein n=1 Tax=Wuchereria bancrofti TaxID=6293 RepID=A0A3P7E9B3_WUCBA|nr:unnamed protein product [Wuchereria bancrofti]
MQLPKGNQILDRTNSRVKLNQETEKNHSPKDSAAVEVEFPASEVPTHKRLVTEGYMEIRQPTAVKRMRIIVKTNRNSMWSNFLYSLKGCSLSFALLSCTSLCQHLAFQFITGYFSSIDHIFLR